MLDTGAGCKHPIMRPELAQSINLVQPFTGVTLLTSLSKKNRGMLIAYCLQDPRIWTIIGSKTSAHPLSLHRLRQQQSLLLLY
jgi:hypothetical protein